MATSGVNSQSKRRAFHVKMKGRQIILLEATSGLRRKFYFSYSPVNRISTQAVTRFNVHNEDLPIFLLHFQIT